MPDVAPPSRYEPRLCRSTLPEGTELWRVSHADVVGVWSTSVADDHFGDGRFDPVAADPFPYCYLGHSPVTALVETLLRGLPYRDDGLRILPRAAVRGRRLLCLRTTRELQLISLLTGPDLAAACQDAWLIHTEASEYGKTRRWGGWLRSRSPWAGGITWPSKRDVGGVAVMLYGDRGRADGGLDVGPVEPRALDDEDGARWLNDCLAPYRVTVRPPRPQRPAHPLPPPGLARA